jgi:predicted nucleic acid-binding protein
MLFETRYFCAFHSFSSRSAKKAETFFRQISTTFEIIKLYRKGGKGSRRPASQQIENEFDVVDVDSEVAGEGDRLAARLKIPMADASIIATAKRLRVACVTDDPHYHEMKLVWI